MARARQLGMMGMMLAPVAASSSMALAQIPPKAPEQCFFARDVNGFSAPNDHTVYIRVGVSKVYRLDLMNDCVNLTYRQSIGLESIPAESWICSPLDATVIYRDTGFPERCPVTAIHQLSPDELAKLPKRDRP